jgi:hypothetical protein
LGPAGGIALGGPGLGPDPPATLLSGAVDVLGLLVDQEAHLVDRSSPKVLLVVEEATSLPP